LAPDRIKVPSPFLVNVPVPEMALLKVRLPLRLTTSAPLLVMVTAEMAPFRSLVPICKVPLPITTVPMLFTPWLATSKLPEPFLVSVPAPAMLPLPTNAYCFVLLLTVMLPGDKAVARKTFVCAEASSKSGEEPSK